MNSFILKTSSLFIAQIMIILSIIMVMRGHNFPGGGFIGALTAVSSVGLLSLAHGFKNNFAKVRMANYFIGFAMMLLLISIIVGILWGQAPLAGIWSTVSILDRDIKLGSPLLFDFAVYLTVCACFSWVILLLELDEND